MRIGIVEDEKQMQDILAGYVDEITKHYGISCHILLMEKWQDLEEKDLIDILLLDYGLEEKNGMEIAREYRKKNPKVCIIFVTGHEEYACEGYEVQAFRYLLKPINKEKFIQAIHDALALQTVKTVTLQTHAGEITISQNDIIYVEANSHKKGTLVRTTDNVIEEQRSLSKMEQLLDIGVFIKSHKSFLVNLEHIKAINGKEIRFFNDERAEISVRHKSEVEHAWWKYQWERGSC